MSNKLPLLLVADTSTREALGSKFLRGARTAGLDPERDLVLAYNSPAEAYSPSMKRLRGKLFYRIADRRSWEWWGFQRDLVSLIREHKPRLVLVTGILPLASNVFKVVHSNGGRIANYLTDDPWNPIHRRHCFIRNLCEYDHIFSTKEALRTRLENAGAPSTSWLPFAFDPELHQKPDGYNETGPDILFIGTGAKERLTWLRALEDLPVACRKIHGNNWERIRIPGWEKDGAVIGEKYCELIASAKIVLGLLRRANGDLSTDRSYEISAIGGCGLYEDTTEHRNLFKDYPEAGFFKNPQELREKALQLLANPRQRALLREKGHEAIKSQGNTYGDRLKEIVDFFQFK